LKYTLRGGTMVVKKNTRRFDAIKSVSLSLTLIFLVICLSTQTAFGQNFSDEIKKFVEVTEPKYLADVEVNLNLKSLTYEKNLIAAYFDKTLFDTADATSFYKAFRVWKEYLPDRPSGKYYSLREIHSPENVPLTINEQSLVKLLIEYKIDRIVIPPDWDISPRPTDFHQVFFYPQKEFAEEFIKDLRNLDFVIDCKIKLYPFLDPSMQFQRVPKVNE
jgi:hypothetical protein